MSDHSGQARQASAKAQRRQLIRAIDQGLDEKLATGEVRREDILLELWSQHEDLLTWTREQLFDGILSSLIYSRIRRRAGPRGSAQMHIFGDPSRAIFFDGKWKSLGLATPEELTLHMAWYRNTVKLTDEKAKSAHEDIRKRRERDKEYLAEMSKLRDRVKRLRKKDPGIINVQMALFGDHGQMVANATPRSRRAREGPAEVVRARAL